MTDPHIVHSLQYFAASLAGIARALDDFGYREEALQIFRVKQRLESEAGADPVAADPSSRAVRRSE